MLDKQFYVSAKDYWSGRVDTDTDYDSFRWHQWVKCIDLNNISTEIEEEIKNIKLKFCFIGFCSEQGVQRNKGRVGTALAPDFIRKQMSNLPCSFSNEVKLYDAGNIVLSSTESESEEACAIEKTVLNHNKVYNAGYSEKRAVRNAEELPLEKAQMMLGEAVEKILKLGFFPIVLGGGHETTFGHFLGQYNFNKASKEYIDLDCDHRLDIGVVNFDAHFDLRPYDNGCSSGSMFRQMYDLCEKEGNDFGYLPLGIQQHSNTISLFKKAKDIGADYVLAKAFQYGGSNSSILEKIDTFMYNQETAYITICTDVFSSAFAPGVSASQTLGLDPEIVIPIIKHLIRTRKIKGFDICEISPRFDQDNTTANLGAVIIYSVINTICKINNLDIDYEINMF